MCFEGFLCAAVLAAVLLPACAAGGPGHVYTPDGEATVEWTAEDQSKPRAARPHHVTETASFLFVRLAANEPLHRHDKSDATIVVLQGRARVTVGEQRVVMERGDVLFVPRGTPHGVENLTSEPLQAFAVFSPKADPADRIYLDAH